jgi:pterin-4a-carbinolamine dehydratase
LKEAHAVAKPIFISYRRSDSQHAAFAIADRLGWAFGHEHVFFDRSSIEGGDTWPDAIREAVSRATVVLVIIGKGWLRVADDWGRRRLDNPNDWVHQELRAAFARLASGGVGPTVIPVCLDGASAPPPEALDAPLQSLTTYQVVDLPSGNWEQALEGLIEKVRAATGLPRIQRNAGRNPNGSPERPSRVMATQKRLDDAEIRSQLERRLPRWELVWSPHIWGVDGYAQEVSALYAFDAFREAVTFMTYVSPAIDAWKPPHHPRWENQWKVVSVFFTTWDIGCRVTQLDLDAAVKLDELYRAFKALPNEQRTGAS